MNPFSRYQQHPDAHESRPWWRKSGGTELRVGLRLYYEVDGVWLAHPTWKVPRVLVRAHISWGVQKPDTIEPPDVDEMTALADREHPLPPPEPLVGQVWAVWVESVEHHIEKQIEAIDREVGFYCFRHELYGYRKDRGTHGEFRWPPGDAGGPALLLSGPGAPWAPAGWTP